MFKDKIFASLQKAVETKQDTLIITDKNTGKFVQFALWHEGKKSGLVVDVPFIECNDAQKTMILKILPDRSYDVENNEVAATKAFLFNELNDVATLSEKILVKAFGTKEGSKLEIEMF